MRNSNYARLINAEAVYKEKIRQLEKENQELRYLVDPLILDEYDNGDHEEADVIEGEVVDLAEESQYGRDTYYPPTGPVKAETVKPWTMWHDPDGNEYDK